MRCVAHGAGNFSYGHLPRGVPEAIEVAAILGKPIGDFQAKRDRLGVHSVRAADLRRVLKLPRAAFEHLAETHEAVLDQSRGFAKLQGLRGVHDVIRRQAVVQPARGAGIADGFSDGHRERDDVVLDLGFQFRDATHHAGVDSRILVDRCGRGCRHDAALGKRLRRGQLHLEPAPELALVAPHAAHLFARIS